MIIGIDASRNRSGGSKAYLMSILSNLDYDEYEIEKIHIWSYKSLLSDLPRHSKLILHSPWQLNSCLPLQLIWQKFKLAIEVSKYKCEILFTTDASTLCRFKPQIILSQDMLSYEPGIMKLYGLTWDRMRLLAILFLQNRAFKFAEAVIFLTKYSSKVIRSKCADIKQYVLIPHGIELKEFQNPFNSFPTKISDPIECIYISSSDLYKNHSNVVLAIDKLINEGFNCHLTLVGGGKGLGHKKLQKTINKIKGLTKHVEQYGFLSPSDVRQKLRSSHLFIFASSCENMPITLLEGMASSLPIACSNRGPMPEILKDGGVYFDPDDVTSIYLAIRKIIIDGELRKKIIAAAKNSSQDYSWQNCQINTWTYILNFVKNKR